MEIKHLSPRRAAYDRALRFLLSFSAFLTCALLVVLIGYIFYRGLPEVSWEMLTTEPSVLRNVIGILPNLINTLVLIVGTLLVVLPLGVGAAIYLTEYARSRRVVELIEFATETLTGIPSILYGLVGMLFFVQFLGWGGSIRAGIFTLVIMILPTIVRTTQESLKTVPQAYREAALGLGSGKWHMIRTVVLPSSVDGIVTGCILSIGRIVGESAALLYTAGSASVLVGSLGKLLTTSGGSLTVALYMYTMERGKITTGFAIASILMILTLIINLSAKWLGRKLKRK
ncbi:MAG: phosphate ABC transporter permease PstA [Pseudoflavonifractor sp.]|nr:phosphate ABC transporter permease PstA [Pseudoflavonifractor sp.]